MLKFYRIILLPKMERAHKEIWYMQKAIARWLRFCGCWNERLRFYGKNAIMQGLWSSDFFHCYLWYFFSETITKWHCQDLKYFCLWYFKVIHVDTSTVSVTPSSYSCKEQITTLYKPYKTKNSWSKFRII